MYVIYCLLLWALVYSLPALAIFPNLVCSSRTAFAIPILSVFIIYCISSLLIALGFLTTSLATFIVIGLGAIAIWRIRRIILSMPFDWSLQDRFIYVFHLILLFPYFIKLGTHAFERGDEIYSWNFWAIQHYFLEKIDFSHTSAPYPQLFPKLLAFCYHIVGSTELQLPVKASLIIFPYAMLCAIAMAYRHLLSKHLGTYLVLLTYVLGGVGLEQFFDDGYADPIMTSCLLVSAVLFWQSQQISTSMMAPIYLGLLSVLAGITAAHAKQPGLLWAIFSLPIMMWLTPKDKFKLGFRLLGIVSILGGMYWVIGEGRQFHQNNGVLWLSLGDRNAFSQLIFAINKYFVHQPLLFILFLFAFFVSFKEKTLKYMLLFFVLPSLLCWFFFGAYHLRLGQHLIAFTFFIVLASGFTFPNKFGSWVKGMDLPWNLFKKHFLIGCLCISMSVGVYLFVQGVWVDKPGISLYAGGRQSLQRYFGQDADYIYRYVYSEQSSLLWVPSRYLYGLFYKHTQLTTPDYMRYQTYNQAALIDELIRKSPDYVFTVSQNVIDGPASGLLGELILECPQAFEKVTHSQNRFSFITYRVNKGLLQQDPCLRSKAKIDLNEVVAFGL